MRAGLRPAVPAGNATGRPGEPGRPAGGSPSRLSPSRLSSVSLRLRSAHWPARTIRGRACRPR
jgi:hypothetical protein